MDGTVPALVFYSTRRVELENCLNARLPDRQLFCEALLKSSFEDLDELAAAIQTVQLCPAQQWMQLGLCVVQGFQAEGLRGLIEMIA